MAGGKFIKCAVCEVISGIRTGSMPNGTMSWRILKQPLPGFSGSDTIEFSYHFPNGRLANGKSYSGTGRRAYLPRTTAGYDVFKAMVVAFLRRL